MADSITTAQQAQLAEHFYFVYLRLLIKDILPDWSLLLAVKPASGDPCIIIPKSD